MKKQIISSVMCVAMCLTAAPSAAYADFSPNIADSTALENNVEAGDYVEDDNEYICSQGQGVITKIRFYTSGSQAGTLEYTGYGKFGPCTFSSVCSNGNDIKKIVIKNKDSMHTFDAITGIYHNFFEVEEIVLPDTITEIGRDVFNSCCRKLKKINIPLFLNKLGMNAFTNTKIERISLPSGVKELPAYAFCEAESLKYITLSSDITVLPFDCFYRTQISDFDFSYIKEIGEFAFGCCKFKTLTLTNGVEKIGKNAFSGNKDLTQVVLPASVNEIGDYAFSGCDILTSITVKNKNCKLEGTRAFGDIKHEDGSYTIVKCYYNSTAHKYAMKNGYHFELLDKPTGLLYGDANMDGAVTWSDVMAVLQYVANEDKYPLSDMGKINADCYNVGDGITGNDANAISDYLTGGTDWLPKPVKK